MIDRLEDTDKLDDFLFEHEILDDRERDRDFFVATRALTRLVEKKPSKRLVNFRDLPPGPSPALELWCH